MLKNEKLISRIFFVIFAILVFDNLFTLFNNHMWPILNIPTIEIYGLPFYLMLCIACYKLPNIRNNKYVIFPVYIIIALNIYGILYNIIN